MELNILLFIGGFLLALLVVWVMTRTPVDKPTPQPIPDPQPLPDPEPIPEPEPDLPEVPDGYTLCVVSNLKDSGSGSFRDYAQLDRPRYITFDDKLSGYIDHTSGEVKIAGDCIIVGGKSPIIMRRGGVRVYGDNVSIYNCNFIAGNEKQPNNLSSRDSLVIGHPDKTLRNILLKNCSILLAPDEVLSVYKKEGISAINVTIDNCLIGFAMGFAGHIDEKNKEQLAHPMVAFFQGVQNLTIKNSVFAIGQFRMPMLRDCEHVEFVNNFVYAWDEVGKDGAIATRFTRCKEVVCVGNVWKSINDKRNDRALMIDDGSTVYVDDLLLHKKDGTTVQLIPHVDKATLLIDSPFKPSFAYRSADEIEEKLSSVGALPRSKFSTLLIQHIRNHTVPISSSKFHVPDKIADLGGW